VDHPAPRDHAAPGGAGQLAAGFAAVLLDAAAGAGDVVLEVDEPEVAEPEDDAELEVDEPEVDAAAPVEEVVVDRESLR
jgi:hypothetical protein